MLKSCMIAAPLLLLASLPVEAQQASMTFFITSTPIGNGGNLGGLAGADNQCQTLAQAVGVGGAKTWRAYLSTQPADGKPAIHIHVVVGRRDGSAMAGHLGEAHVRPTLEAILTESPAHLRKRVDPESGLALIRIDA